MNRRTFLAKLAVVAAALPVIGPILRERERRKVEAAKLFDYFYQLTINGSEQPPTHLIVCEDYLPPFDPVDYPEAPIDRQWQYLDKDGNLYDMVGQWGTRQSPSLPKP